MDSQILELLHIINDKIDTVSRDNKVINHKIDNVIDRINDIEKDINNKTSISSSSNEYLTVKEIIEIYKISKEKIYQDIKSNEFTQKYSQKKNGGKILIKKRDWDLWFNSYIVPNLLNEYRSKIKIEDLENDFSNEEKELVEEIIKNKETSTNKEKKSMFDKIKSGEEINLDF